MRRRFTNNLILTCELICFFTKKGAETLSPYEAQVWKENSISVYAKLKNNNGITFDVLVRRIHFRYQHNASITAKVGDSIKKYELSNAFCDIHILRYDELHFFIDNGNEDITGKEALDNVIDISSESDFNNAIAKGQILSIVYIDDINHLCPTTGIIRYIQEYNEESRTISSKVKKYFLLENH